MWRSILILLALLQQPTLAATWQPTALHVTWQADDWHCAYLVGGNLPDALIGCGADRGDVLLPVGGVSHVYAPQLRSAVRLDTGDMVRIPPRYRVILPLITKNP